MDKFEKIFVYKWKEKIIIIQSIIIFILIAVCFKLQLEVILLLAEQIK